MTPMLGILLLALLWTTAAVFWLMDTPNPAHTADILLESRRHDEQLLAA